jgi:hypothetical protein
VSIVLDFRGKEVDEGAIVKIPMSGGLYWVAVVKCVNGEFRCRARGLDVSLATVEANLNWGGIEVIGHIYEEAHPCTAS